MTMYNRKRTRLKSRRKIAENIKLIRQINLTSSGANEAAEVLIDSAEKKIGEKLAGYYVQLFFLS